MNSEKGQTLITLLIFVVVAVSVTTAAIMLTVMSSSKATARQESTITYNIAESGAENALMRLIRDTNYSGETLPVGNGTALVTVTGTNPKTIRSTGTNGNFQRTVEITVNYTNNILTVSSWKEVY